VLKEFGFSAREIAALQRESRLMLPFDPGGENLTLRSL